MIGWAGFRVGVDDRGALVLRAADWRLTWDLSIGGGSDFATEAVGPPRLVRIEHDEIESVLERDGLQITVRHTFETAWHTRITVENTGTMPAPSDALRIGWRVVGSASAWCWPGGCRGFLAALPDAGAEFVAQQVRGGDLRDDAAEAEGAAGAEGPVGAGAVLGAALPGPGERRVHTLRTRMIATERWPALVPAELPPLELAEGEPLQLAADDLAVEPSAALADTADGLLPRHRVGRYPVLLHGSEGVWRLKVSWAPEPAKVLHRRASDLLTAAPVVRGVRRLESSLAALIVLRSRADADAVDAWCARQAQPADHWAVTALAERALEVGEPLLLEQAIAAVTDLPARRGAGFAAGRVLVAASALGETGTGAGAGHPDALVPVFARLCQDPEVRLELTLPGLRAGAGLDAALRRVRSRLGLGLPGDPLALPGDRCEATRAERQAWWVAIGALLADESGLAELGRLADARSRRLLAGGPDDVSLAWLTM